MFSYNVEPSKLEGCWSAHPRRARADSKLVVVMFILIRDQTGKYAHCPITGMQIPEIDKEE